MASSPLVLLNRSRLERALQQEMEAHRAALGAPARFGNVLRLREESRDVWGWTWIDDVLRDLRHGGRVLRRSPGFTASAFLTLTIGIGLNLTVFQLVNVTLLQPPRVSDPETLVRFFRRSPNSFAGACRMPRRDSLANTAERCRRCS